MKQKLQAEFEETYWKENSTQINKGSNPKI